MSMLQNILCSQRRIDDTHQIAQLPRARRVEHAVDDIIFATGFDAMTGAIKAVPIRGKGGATIKESWKVVFTNLRNLAQSFY